MDRDETTSGAGVDGGGGLLVRPATATDAAAMAAIYNHAVVHSTATFDLEPESVEERRAWLGAESTRLALVAEVAGRLVGWSSLARWSGRGAYDQTVEASVYVAPAAQRTGLGRALGAALVEGARALELHVLIAQICTENDGGRGLALALGYRPVGTLREVGCKFGRRLDVTICQLIL